MQPIQLSRLARSFIVLGILAGCGQPADGGDGGAPPAPSGSTQPAATAQGSPPPSQVGVSGALTPPAAAEAMEDEAVPDHFQNGAAAFAQVRDSLLKSYYAEGLSEDDLYRAATAGMLEKLDPHMKEWQKLMTARELGELKNDLKGEVVGVGVRIKFDPASGYADVLDTIAGTPAEKAGLVAGDKIVTVNGKLYKGMRFTDVVADIRGKAGEPVALSVLRADKLIAFRVLRERLAYDRVTQAMHEGGVGYLQIPSFNDQTPGAARAALESLTAAGAKSLVIDLRGSPGGSFERAVETASLLLPEGTGIVSLKRKGKAEDKHVAKGPSFLVDVPVAVLVDGGTSSGAEFVTAALREGRHAVVVGAKTKGKWSVQTIDELPNGWAFKYTIALFHSPAGVSYERVGLSPDVEVSMPEGDLARAKLAKTPQERATLDVQLRTARELLIRR